MHEFLDAVYQYPWTAFLVWLAVLALVATAVSPWRRDDDHETKR